MKYRINETLLTPTNLDNQRPSVLVISSENQVDYLRDSDIAVIADLKKGKVRKKNLFLGVVNPKHIDFSGFNVNSETNKIDGHEVIAYELTIDGIDGMTKIYADPALGYRYRKVEYFNNGYLVRTLIAKDYKFFDGIPYPTFHERKDFEASPGNKLLKSETTQIQKASFNQKIDSDVFNIKFTTNTWITDLSLGMRFKPFVDFDLESLESLSIEDLTEIRLENKAKEMIDKDIQRSQPQEEKVEANNEDRIEGNMKSSDKPQKTIYKNIYFIAGLVTFVFLIMVVCCRFKKLKSKKN